MCTLSTACAQQQEDPRRAPQQASRGGSQPPAPKAGFRPRAGGTAAMAVGRGGCHVADDDDAAGLKGSTCTVQKEPVEAHVGWLNDSDSDSDDSFNKDFVRSITTPSPRL